MSGTSTNSWVLKLTTGQTYWPQDLKCLTYVGFKDAILWSCLFALSCPLCQSLPLGLASYNVDFSYVFLVLVCWLGSSVKPWSSLVHPRNIVSSMEKRKKDLFNTLYNWKPIKKTWENKQTSPSWEEPAGRHRDWKATQEPPFKTTQAGY